MGFVMKMNYKETFSKVLQRHPQKDYEKRIFDIKKYLEHGHLQ